MNAPAHDRSDSAWLAYRYVSGELAGAELARFEERLSEDQSARETVAEVVDLCAAIEALPRSTFSPAAAGLRIWHAASWMAVGAAACLAMMFGMQFTLRSPGLRQAAQSNESDAAGDRRLALSWTQQTSTHESPSTDADGSTAEASSVADGSDALSDMESGDSESSEPESSEPENGATHDADGLEPPGWVTAAIDESVKPAAPANTKIEETP